MPSYRRNGGRKLRGDIPCGYCFQEWATEYDHIRPVRHGGTNHKDNLYPACHRCNMLVGARYFSSLEEKRNYVQEELKKRGEWNSGEEMRELREGVPTE